VTYRTLLVVVMMFTMAPAAFSQQHSPDVGIDRSNLIWESPHVQAQAMRGIHALGAQWVRDGLSGHSPSTDAAFVQELSFAKQDGLKFLAIVGVKSGDYDAGYHNPNPGDAFKKACGWQTGSPEISRVDIARFKSRLKQQLDAVKAAGLLIDGFEIGNEYDSSCFDGDVPFGHEASAEEFENVVGGYAHLLRAAATLIHNPAYFPAAPIITFGIAHISDRTDKFNHHITDPDRIIAALQDFGGFNYLDNGDYKISGIGSHIYVGVDGIDTKAPQLLAADAVAGGGMPVWITEWGFNTWAFRKRTDLTRADAFTRFYAMLDRQPISLGPSFIYAYSEHKGGGWSLVDDDGNLRPEAEAIALRARR